MSVRHDLQSLEARRVEWGELLKLLEALILQESLCALLVLAMALPDNCPQLPSCTQQGAWLYGARCCMGQEKQFARSCDTNGGGLLAAG